MAGDGSCGAYFGGVLVIGDHLGRHKADFRAFEAAGGHTDKCPQLVGSAARWIVEFLHREGLLAEG